MYVKIYFVIGENLFYVIGYFFLYIKDVVGIILYVR